MPDITNIYDELGRVAAVVDVAGDTASIRMMPSATCCLSTAEFFGRLDH